MGVTKIIKLENIEKTYGKADNEVKALKKVNLEISKGEMVALMGKSGAGKSTLLNILGCIDKASNGQYYLNGKDISTSNDNTLSDLRNEIFGFIIQNYAVINHLSVIENVEIPLYYSKKKIDKRKRIKELLDKLGIGEKSKKKVKELSGGQCQRVAIARALVNDPEIILADEPTGALDEQTSKEIMEIFTQLNKEGKTVIIVTHDKDVASYCNRIITIEDGIINL